jgi:hypothetical protein
VVPNKGSVPGIKTVAPGKGNSVFESIIMPRKVWVNSFCDIDFQTTKKANIISEKTFIHDIIFNEGQKYYLLMCTHQKIWRITEFEVLLTEYSV